MLARGIVAISMLVVAPPMDARAIAQVINGESIYEDNFVHTPPPQDATGEAHRDTTKTHRQVDGAEARRPH